MRPLLLMVALLRLAAVDALGERELWEESLRLEQAGSATAAAVVLAPLLATDDYLAHLRCGWLARSRQAWDEALAAYDRAQRLAPAALEPQQGRLRTLVEASRWDAAETAARRLLLSDPGDPAIAGWLVLILERQGRIAEALRENARILARRPSDTTALAAAGRLSNANGQPDEARSAWRRLLRLDPGNAQATASLAALVGR